MTRYNLFMFAFSLVFVHPCALIYNLKLYLSPFYPCALFHYIKIANIKEEGGVLPSVRPAVITLALVEVHGVTNL